MSMMVMLLFLFFLLRSCSEVKVSEVGAASICLRRRAVEASMIAVGMMSTHIVLAITM